MANQVKQFFEKLVYAGLKPQGGRPAQQSEASHAEPKQAANSPLNWLNTKLNQAGPADPLYLSNRTAGQKVKSWALIGIPPLVVLTAVGLVLAGVFNPTTSPAPPPSGPTNAEIASKMLPDLQNISIETQHDLEVADVHVIPGAPVRLEGVAKNNSDHEISKAELVFDLTDKTGSRQGAVTTEVKNIGAKSTVQFQFAIEQATATFALVREVRVQ